MTLPLSHDAFDRLKHYQDTLIRWQSSINLISASTKGEIWKRHILDSLQLSAFIPPKQKVYDIGSGAGFPGMVLAITRPDLEVSLIESDAKKCAFLKAVSRETNTVVKICNFRIEKSMNMPAPDIITARALASTSDLLNYILPWCERNSDLTAVFLKGKLLESELKDARGNGWSFLSSQYPSTTDPNGRVVVINQIKR